VPAPFNLPDARPAIVGSASGAQREGGFTLIEMLVAIFILMVGIVATLGLFTSSKTVNLVAQRHEIAVHQAQREMELLRSLKYSQMGLKSAPSTSTNPKNPDYRVQSGSPLQFRVITSPVLDEELVLPNNDGPSATEAAIDTGPDSFVAGQGTAGVTGKVYRFVSWRDENCPTPICGPGSHDTKRLIVAVTIDPVRNLGPMNPVWLSSVAIDPDAGPTSGTQQQPAPPASSSAQNFYLYDKRCTSDDTQNSYTAPTASHTWPAPPVGTYDTASPATTCENVDATKTPNLMGPAAPSYSDPPLPPYKYSTDLAGDYPAGLAMIKGGSSCPVSSFQLDTGNSDGDANPDTPGKWQVHAWSTRKFTADFDLTGQAFVSLWTTSVGSIQAAGRFCVTLVDRLTVAGVPNDIVLGSLNQTYSPWPTTKNEPGKTCGNSDLPCGRLLTFLFSLSGTTIRSGARLMMFIQELGTSDKDLVFLYDDPRYRSFLELETTTPCNSTGTPCSSS
jgi:type II secretory pathway pseudopilin PulG